jgi:hypothetical protein
MSTSCFAQESTKSLEIQSGYDFYSTQEHGWNIGILGQFKFNESSRWYHEYGINYSQVEYNYGGDEVLNIEDYQEDPSSNFSPSYGSMPSIMFYRKKNIARFHGGVGVVVLEKERQKISVGWDMAASLLIVEKENGEVVVYEYDYPGTNYAYLGSHIETYFIESRKVKAYRIELLPYFNYSARISERFWFKTRCSFFVPIEFSDLPSTLSEGVHVQFNLGLNYEF